MRQHVSVPLRFRRSRGNKKLQTHAATAPMPSADGIFAATHAAGARMGLKWAE